MAVGERSRPPSVRRIVLWVFLWTGLGLFFASEAALRQYPGAERSLSWADALTVNIPYYLIWGVLALVVLWLCRRWPLGSDQGGRLQVGNLALHLLASVAVASIHLLLSEALFDAIRDARGQDVAFSEALAFSFRHNFHVNLLTYWAIVGTRQLLAYYHGLREKELMATRLKEQLVRAELAALRMQLQPHFLFNALNSISELVYADPKAADRMLVRLSDLLRRSLETNGAQEIPLAQELEFVERYLEIERMRYSDRMRLASHVDEFALDAAVPSFLLQPLVENAVVHGVGRSAGPCRVVLRARRDEGELYLEVENDLPRDRRPDGKRPEREGVGIQNTRARLEQIYGERARLDLEIRPEGIALARVVLPYRELEGLRNV
ncbi:MAG: histidine kinase [Acidobacteria bacterium]|nr:histidine kinase [Acidobacteriota bacterium]